MGIVLQLTYQLKSCIVYVLDLFICITRSGLDLR
jgi:hypothetical protein